ncbi:ABC transporter permease [Lentisalinibacter orientalis]|uniref:ABC transporter permease n=1 Tax=Lentisalinibacter orientalis TaxID=2992241 RepID=UPI00386B3DE1
MSADRRPAAGGRGWIVVAALIATMTATPLAVAVASLFSPDQAVWAHLAEHVLPRVLVNTLWLVLAVSALTAVIGASLAWLTAACEFPGRRFFNWALLLPLAVPGYVLAFALAGLFEYTGTVQTALRGTFGDGAGLPGLGARAASILTLTLALFPYVYLIARHAFATQGIRGLEVAQSVGMAPAQGFRRVALPMARPWIAAGVALVAMETLADFGTVSVFNYDTFTTAIYQAWFSLFSLDAALQLASVLVLLVAVAVVTERRFRGRARFEAVGSGGGRRRLHLAPRAAWLATGYCSLVFLVAFLLPVLQLVAWTVQTFAAEFDPRYLAFAGRSVFLGLAAALVIVTLALLLAYAVRMRPGSLAAGFARAATLGYAIPGAVLAVGFFVAVVGLGDGITAAARALLGSGTAPVVLTGTVVTMLLAYAARFLAVGHGPVESAMQRIRPSLDDAARGMGVAGLRLLGRVHVPILGTGIATAALLVFVDVMKELPITLMTRPFGWDTLSVRVFQLTSEGHWERASVSALSIVLVGLIPVLLLNRRSG